MYYDNALLYIFDIDGTICNIEHRLHFLEDKTDSYRWDKFYKACVNDKPNVPVIRVMHQLAESGSQIWLFSGRSDVVRSETVDWLAKHTRFTKRQLTFHWELLTMRPIGDYTEDHLLKEKWLKGLLEQDRARLAGVFDDRKRVVDMWRANGVPCFQVADGEF